MYENKCCHSRVHTRKQRRNRNAVHAEFQRIDQKRISRNIDQVHDDGYFHRRFRITLRTENSRTAVVNRQKRNGGRYNHQINIAVSFYLCRNVSKHNMQNKRL